MHDGTAIGESRKWAMLYLDTSKAAAIADDIHDDERSGSEFTEPVLHNRLAARWFAASFAAHATGNEEAMGEQLILLHAGLLASAQLPLPPSSDGDTKSS